jgi:hypothetical protein
LNTLSNNVSIRPIGTKFAILDDGKVGIGTDVPRAQLDIVATSGIVVPVGTTAQRPAAPVFGTIRYNTDLGRGETYSNDFNGDGTQGDTGWKLL